MAQPLTSHLATLVMQINAMAGKIFQSAGIEMGMDQLPIIMMIHFAGSMYQAELLGSVCPYKHH